MLYTSQNGSGDTQSDDMGISRHEIDSATSEDVRAAFAVVGMLIGNGFVCVNTNAADWAQDYKVLVKLVADVLADLH